MIHLEKDGIKIKTNNEETADWLQEDGYTRTRGRGGLTGRIVRRVLFGLVLPGAFGLALFHFVGGRNYMAFFLGIFLFGVVRDFLEV